MLFRSCTLAALISKAFQLKDYQFPGRASLASNSFDVAARVPAGATPEEFLVMLQNLLEERFALSHHFEQQTMRGYHLTIAKGGSKLKASAPSSAVAQPARRPESGDHGFGSAGSNQAGHEHTGVVNFNGRARYQASERTMSDLASMLSNELAKPVDDQTGLKGKYDISLSWTSDNNNAVVHAGGDFGGDHNHGGGGGGAAGPADGSGPTLFGALESQLGLRLVEGEKSATRVFIVDHIEKVPTSN